MNPTIKIKWRPPFVGFCIKNCGREAGATPWLCFPCFRSITAEYISRDHRFNYNEVMLEGMALRRFRNRVQAKSRKAFKKHGL